jgi:hypothetical protein
MQWLIGNIRRAPTLRDKLLYLVKPPGWSHEGRHDTTETIIAAANSAGPDAHRAGVPA